MEEKKIKAILENKISLLQKLAAQMAEQMKAIDQNDELLLTQILDEKETLIGSLVKGNQELEKCVFPLDEKNRIAIAEKLEGLRAQIEDETEKIFAVENECEIKLLNDKFELMGKMKSLKNGRTLLKGYGMSTRIKPKISGSI